MRRKDFDLTKNISSYSNILDNFNLSKLKDFTKEIGKLNINHLQDMVKCITDFTSKVEVIKWAIQSEAKFDVSILLKTLIENSTVDNLKNSEYLATQFKLSINNLSNSKLKSILRGQENNKMKVKNITAKEYFEASFMLNGKYYNDVVPKTLPLSVSLELITKFNNFKYTNALLIMSFLNNNLEIMSKTYTNYSKNASELLIKLNGLNKKASSTNNHSELTNNFELVVNFFSELVNTLKLSQQNDLITKYHDYFTMSEGSVKIISNILIASRQLGCAEVFLEKAISLVKDQGNERYLGALYHQMQRVAIYQQDYSKAVKYGLASIKISPTSSLEVLKTTMINIANNGDKEKFMELMPYIKSSASQNLILQYFYYVNEPDKLDTNLIKNWYENKLKIEPELNKIFQLLYFTVQYEKPNNDLDKLEESIKQLKEVNVNIECLISISIQYNHIKFAKLLLTEAKESMGSNNKYYLTLESLVNDGGDQELLNNINDSTLEGVEKAGLHNDAATYLIAASKLDEATKYIEEALKLEPDNQQYLTTSKDLAVLKGEKNILPKEFDKVSNIDTSTNSTDDILSKVDDSFDWNAYAKQLQTQYIMKKSQKLNEMSGEIIPSHKGWNIKGNHISFTTVKNNKITYKNIEHKYYISDKINNKYKEQMPEVNKAVEKGIITAKLGQYGVKVHSNMITIKPSCELRVCANKIYVNKDNEGLIYFDIAYPNHKVADKSIDISGEYIEYIHEII